jgi:probable F420-dependent oxidoreductase
MKLGLLTPIVTVNPRARNDWEQSAGIEDLGAIAEAADRLGYHHLTCSEHIGLPASEIGRRGTCYWDPLPTFGYLAARTRQIRLATLVLVLGYHHPLAIAKRYGTLDVVSGGRLILGLGVGTLREEFDLLDVPFADRGARADDALRALRASLGEEQPSYHGAYYDYEGLVIDPASIRRDVPIWIGGRTWRSMRRALELGDGWVPFGLDPTELGDMIRRAESTREWAERANPLELVLTAHRALDPIGRAEQTTEVWRVYQELGATALNVRLVHNSLPECLEQLSALVELVGTS